MIRFSYIFLLIVGVGNINAQQVIKRSDPEIGQATLTITCPETMWINFFEKERRIQLDYSLTKGDLLEQLQRRLNGVDEDLMNRWIEEGRFDSREIDGELRFISPSVSNLLFRYPDTKPMRKTPPYEVWGRFVAGMVSELGDDPQSRDKLKPQQYHNHMTVTVDANAVEDGKTIRAWLPIPQENSFQRDVAVIATIPSAKHTAEPVAQHRAVYIEQAASPGNSTEFTVEYIFTSKPRINHINPNEVTTNFPDEVKPWLDEQPPHVIFTDELKRVVEEVVGDEENPYWKAKKLYLWMSENFNYSYAREYSTLDNISMYCLEKKYGDCGQLALTYITLCRIAGIPARWETGWMTYPVLKNLHDWCTIYLPPYGWVPVDVNMGVEAHHQWGFLPQEDRDRITEFYFGNMDPYRMVANSNHGAEFDPPKTHIRSDTVDFQRGEVETAKRNIYYDQFDYSLTILSRKTIDP